MCHIIGIEPQFKNIISNGPFIPMAAGQKKPEAQWTADKRKAANLDQHLKSLIMSVLPDDQMNSVINCLTAKSTWDDLILYHEGPFNVKESRVIDLKLCYNTFKFKEGESLTQTFTKYKALMNELDFQDSPDDEEDTRSSHEYLNDLEEEYQARALLSKSKRFFKKGTQRFSSAKATNQTKCHKCGKKGHFARDCWSKTSVPSYQSPFQSKLLLSSENKPEPRQTKDFEAKYHKVKAKLAFFLAPLVGPSKCDIKFVNLDLITFHSNEVKGLGFTSTVLKGKLMYFYTNFRSNISQGDCFIPFDIKQSFSRLVNLLEVKQHVSTSVKEIDYVQLGIVNQVELKL
ncbi:retrovirus-related pol polyprotein from transposon TNT 1-94 [Tanacetum coccineum]|uniref:Retrovirus-related pol polyprotein from transposon TNT 1-94 n=1 Tax=Tanacetum coccineum TaxID=301880 RepID=A0ABQ5HN46_9ASTR